MHQTYFYIELFSFLMILVYGLFNLLVLEGWRKLLKTPTQKAKSNFISFSILIPMRNEAENILNIVKAIDRQNYPKEHFEIIIIDDASEDNSITLLSGINVKNLRVFSNHGQGKKAAIASGLNHAKNEFIIQTDADCTVGTEWLSSINDYLSEHDVKILTAPVLIKASGTFFSKIQSLDFMALMMSTGGTIGLNKPIMGNAANLIYPKTLSIEINDLENRTASGDDVFLIHQVKKKYGKSSIHFLKSKDATVYTLASKSLSSFFQQRLRWASKAKYYKDKDTIYVGLLVLFVNVLLLFLLILGFFSKAFQSLVIELFISKMLIDFFLLLPILNFYKQVSLIIYIPLMSMLYPFYISFVGLMSPFFSYEWKNRKYR